MTSDTPIDEIIRPVRRLEVVTVGARQRWSEAAKRALVLETFAPGASVSGVARRRGVNPSLAFSWRKRMRDELGFPTNERQATEPAGFLSLVVADPPATHADTSLATPKRGEGGAAIEVELSGGARMRISGAANADLVVAILKVLSRR